MVAAGKANAMITNVWVSFDEDLICVEMDDGTRFVYWQREAGDIVRQHERFDKPAENVPAVMRVLGKTMMSNRWGDLIAKYHAHPANWKNKQTARMMRLYEEHRNYEAQKQAQRSFGVGDSDSLVSGSVLGA